MMVGASHHHLHDPRNGISTPVIFSRDFAYTDNRPVVLAPPMRIASIDIRATSAKIFAEYVCFQYLLG